MVSLVSNTLALRSMSLIGMVLPIGIGIASAAYLGTKVASNNPRFHDGTPIPTVSLHPGDSTHDREYNEDQDAFLRRCEEDYGSTFNVLLFNKTLTVVSGAQIREVFMNDDLSSVDSFEEFTSITAFFNTMRKSNHDTDHQTIRALVQEHVTPNLSSFMARIVEQLGKNLKHEPGISPAGDEGNLVVNPMLVVQTMVAGAMASVFVGPEIAQSPDAMNMFLKVSEDFSEMQGSGEAPRASFWNSLVKRANYKVLNRLQIHVQNLTRIAAPVVLERQRLEAEAMERGNEYERPRDVLQQLLDNFDKHGFVDLEDVCGHLLILVLASVHATTDASTILLYYLATSSSHMETLYEEQQDVLDAIQREREQERQELLKEGSPIIKDLDAAHDRELSAAAVQRMVKLDSFVREMFRFRTERLTLAHRARKNVTLSNGMVIPRGHSVIINMKSAHQGPEQGEDATEFKPWRFVGKPKSATKVGTDFLPFGMGKHVCPGRFLAIQEVKAIGALMISRYSKIQIQNPSETAKVLRSRPAEPLCTGLVFTSRN
ncbi:cytochrome P450 [Mortierella sp. GBAus27b]|nr:hypothetical protein BGX31_006836 [Mortierella sp. GBA43]KAI8350951.1 cytochrome P450 [Mortierella sp. GBAus27b]